MVKTVLRIFLLLSTFAAVCPPASLAKSAKPVVAVFYFEADGASDYVGETVAGYLMTALAYLGKYKVVDPEKIKKISEGSDLSRGEALSTEKAAALGKKLGAIVACRGRVTKKGNKYTITVDCISTANGAVITSNSANVSGEANLSKGIDRIVGLTKD
jgi:TolB-like protein